MRLLGAVLAAASLFGAEVPRPAPAMVFPTPSGGSVDVAKLKGKAVCLAFLLTTCGHCQNTSVILQRIQNDMGPRGVQVVGVTTNPMSHMLIPDFARNFGVKFPLGYTDEDHAHQFLQHPTMQVMYYPQLVFIDKSGVIRMQTGGNDNLLKGNIEGNLRAELEKLLAPAPAQAARQAAKK
jgi:peroxiredoxin